MLLLVAGGIFGTLWYIRKLDQDKILGLNDDARALMAEWHELAAEEKFDEAEIKIDEAKILFQKVLAVNDTDETAATGLSEVDEAARELRRLRAKAAQAQALREQREQLIAEGRKSIDAGLADSVWGFRHLELAHDKAAAVLALEPANKDALSLKATAANELAKWARNERRWEIMKLWIDRLEATGLLVDELKDRKNEWNRR
ncbi:MAG: hypothetical protein M5U25_02905 [Planctomycetota bacterium]|nr:hypothetical protein [Planctomycetota bacterium]